MVKSKHNCDTLAVILMLLLSGLPSFAQAGTWATKAPMPTPRGVRAAGVFDGDLYVAGGGSAGLSLSLVETYNPSTDSWSTKAPMPTAGGDGADVIDGKLYVVGGMIALPSQGGVFLSSTQVYDPNADTWTQKSPMPSARTGFAVAAVDGVLYVAGGWHSPPFADLSTLEAYDPKTNSWTTKAPMATPRAALVLVACDHHLYAIGGEDHPTPSGRVLTTVEAYDPNTNSWTTGSSMPTPRGAMAAAVINGIIYVAGGGNTTSVLNTVEAYDPKNDTWTEAPAMPTARYNAAVGVAGGSMYVIGGQDSSAQTLAVNEAFTPFEMVSIDIKPGDRTNTINLKSHGVVPVAILGSATFDPMTVDPTSVTFARAPVASRGRGALMTNESDVNNDGYPDLVLFFRTQQLQLTPSSTEAVLYGTTYSGQRIRGSDNVRIVPAVQATTTKSPGPQRRR